MRSHPCGLLLRGELRPELHPAPHDAVGLDGVRGAVRRRLEIVPRVRLADVGGEGTLELRVARAGEEEVVVPVKMGVNCQIQRSNVKRRSGRLFLTSWDRWRGQDRP